MSKTVKSFSPLPKAKQIYLESWANSKRGLSMDQHEEKIVAAIDHFKRFGWPVEKATHAATNKREATAKLNLLKLKQKTI